MSATPIELARGPGSGVPRLLTAAQAARCLAVSPKTLWTLTSRGEIPCVRMGRSVRYDVLDLDRFIESRKSVKNAG